MSDDLEIISNLLYRETPYLSKGFHDMRIGGFGSCFHGTETEASNVDMIVEFNRVCFIGVGVGIYKILE